MMRSLSYLAAVAVLVVVAPALQAGDGYGGKSRGVRRVKCPALRSQRAVGR